jgi:hypothetical protein
VVGKIAQGMEATTLDDFLKRLTGPELQLQLQWSMVEAMAHKLRLTAKDKDETKKLDISLVGFRRLLYSPPPPTGPVSRFSLKYRIPYGVLVGSVFSLMTSLLFFCGFWISSDHGSPWDHALRVLGRTGHIVLGLLALVVALLLALIAMLILSLFVPDNTFWVPVAFLTIGGLIYVACMGGLEFMLKSLGRSPEWVRIGAGVATLWFVSGLLGYVLLG